MVKVIVGMTYPWTGLTSAVSGAAQWWNFGLKEAEAEKLINYIRTRSPVSPGLNDRMVARGATPTP